MNQQPHGICRTCQYWEPLDGVTAGYCPVFDKHTEPEHGSNCTAWTQMPPPSLFDEGRNEEISEDMRREGIAGTRLIGELGLGILALLVTVILVALWRHSTLAPKPEPPSQVQPGAVHQHPACIKCGRCGKRFVLEPRLVSATAALEHPALIADNTDSCSALCDDCWADLKTPEARLPYYRELLNEWDKADPAYETYWPSIREAVMSGQ